jgi:TetR/AcrR family transcriptional repressor of bet genes
MPGKISSPRGGAAALRRDELIAATISEIAVSGLSKTTVARIAGRVGLAAGSINFYFGDKETLLFQTLSYLVKEYDEAVFSSLESAGNHPAARLEAFAAASTAPAMISRDSICAWYAFTADPDPSADAASIIKRQNIVLHNILHDLCEEIIELGGPKVRMSADAMAFAVGTVLDGIWEEVFTRSEKFEHAGAKAIYGEFFASVFPWCFELNDGESAGLAVSSMPSSYVVRRADLGDVPELARLLIGPMQDGMPPANLQKYKTEIRAELSRPAATIFAAIDEDGYMRGFAQLNLKSILGGRENHWSLVSLVFQAENAEERIAPHLIDTCKTFVQASGGLSLTVSIRDEDLSSIDIYRNVGFRRERDVHRYCLQFDQDRELLPLGLLLDS